MVNARHSVFADGDHMVNPIYHVLVAVSHMVAGDTTW